MGNKLAIKGHPIRSKEVIALLEMMGGKNYSNIGNDDVLFYYINDKNNIEFGWTMWDNNPLYTIFTLEEFLDKFPFKDNYTSMIVADLSLHYFKKDDTIRIINEIKRV